MSTSLPLLNKRFETGEHYASRCGVAYSLLPFRFLPLDSKRYVITNIAGEHIVLERELLHSFVCHKLSQDSPLYNNLKAKHFLMDGDSTVALDLLATKYRTKQSHLADFTCLHMFVVTLRCDHTCSYCQVSRQPAENPAFDMSEESANKAIEFLFQSPSRSLKVEFQGGEPLLHFPMIKFIVEQVKERNEHERRNITFVITTNLAPLADEHLRFCLEHDVYLSTSLDGPRELHNRNRPRPGKDSYEKTIEGIRRARELLGPHKIAALMTTTAESLKQPRAIIDEYVKQGFHSIFLRSISPYGFAVTTGQAERYQIDQWLEFYKAGLAYIIELNQNGLYLREDYASLILRKVLTPFATGYVDLQSPAGAALSAIVFNYDGDVYATDESRMLAEMNDKSFRLGNLVDDSYDDMMGSEWLLELLGDTMSEAVPSCTDCGVQPYCGSEPIYHHRTQGDRIGFKPTSGFCRKNMTIIRHLIELLEDNPPAARVLRSWI